MPRFWRRRSLRIDELDRELEGHLELAVEARMAAGVSPGEAREGARRELERLGLTRQALRDTGRGATFTRQWRSISRTARRFWGLER